MSSTSLLAPLPNSPSTSPATASSNANLTTLGKEEDPQDQPPFDAVLQDQVQDKATPSFSTDQPSPEVVQASSPAHLPASAQNSSSPKNLSGNIQNLLTKTGLESSQNADLAPTGTPHSLFAVPTTPGKTPPKPNATAPDSNSTTSSSTTPLWSAVLLALPQALTPEVATLTTQTTPIPSSATTSSLQRKIFSQASSVDKVKPSASALLSSPSTALPASNLLDSVEKISSPSLLKGIFLQPHADSSSALSARVSNDNQPSSLSAESIDIKQLMSLFGNQLASQNSISETAPKLGVSSGTPPAEQNVTMTTATKISDSLSPSLMSNGYLNNGNPTALLTPNQPTVTLHSNQEFTNALKQVLQIAQTTPTTPPNAPQRLSIELQTPPGAIVNVYVSHQNGQWRTQLSTNDPQALTWIQDKMPALRQSSDFSSDLRWLPPQMESGQNSSYSNPNGQRQNQPQHQNQRTPHPQNDDDSTDFMNTIQQIGRGQ